MTKKDKDAEKAEFIYGKRPPCPDNLRMLLCCGATAKLDEIDGAEFYTDSIDDLISALKQYKAVHMAYWIDEDDKDVDLWVKAV